MIEIRDGFYALHTKETTYAFRVMETGQLEHLYYGRRITIVDFDSLVEKHAFAPGNTIAYDQDHMDFSLEDMCLELSGYGKGDIREPFVEVVCADGSNTTDFVFVSAEQIAGKEPMATLPGSYDEQGQVEQLLVTMRDKNHGFVLEIRYYVFEDTDVITRTARFVNASEEEVRLTRLMSMQLDLNQTDYVVTSFHGGWAKEMNRYDTMVNIGKFVNASYTGGSSSRVNPFFMVRRPGLCGH